MGEHPIRGLSASNSVISDEVSSSTGVQRAGPTREQIMGEVGCASATRVAHADRCGYRERSA